MAVLKRTTEEERLFDEFSDAVSRGENPSIPADVGDELKREMELMVDLRKIGESVSISPERQKKSKEDLMEAVGKLPRKPSLIDRSNGVIPS